jgi:6-pyruvoyltetrahydropterin/6-carboxytetrahydropterin synthase
MSTYTLALREKFKARHAFEEKKGTAEGIPHSHDYCMEIQLHGDELDKNGYLIDLDEITLFLNETRSRFADVFLNDLPEFSNFPPSLEHFARILCDTASHRLKNPRIQAISVKLWENENAWASFCSEKK